MKSVFRPVLAVLICVAGFCETGSVVAQSAGVTSAIPDAPPPLTNGFVVRLTPKATIKEMQRQQRLFEMEVTFKSMRLRQVELTDPATGEKSKEIVWYLVYRAVNRQLPRPQQTSTEAPVNVEDPQPPPLFVPRFVLVTNDNGVTKVYPDVILPDAQAAINRREARYKDQPKLKNSVQLTGPVPPAVPEGAQQENAIYGVAIFRGVDPETDFFTVYMAGFSNAYIDRPAAEALTDEELRDLFLSTRSTAGSAQPATPPPRDELLKKLFPLLGAGQKDLVYRKIIVQKYKRPGDRFLPDESEFQRIPADNPQDPQTYYPRWIYVPDDILPARNSGSASKPPVP